MNSSSLSLSVDKLRVERAEELIRAAMREAWESGWTFAREVTIQICGRRCCALGAVIAMGFADVRERPLWFASDLIGVTHEEARAIAAGFDGAAGVGLDLTAPDTAWADLGRRLFEFAKAEGWTVRS